jgi:hypothetical protein
MGSSGQPRKHESSKSGKGLHVQDASRYGDGTEHPRDDDAPEKEHSELQRHSWNRMERAPEEAGRQEAVVETLIGGERGRGSCGIEAIPKRPQPQRPRPQEHLEDQELRDARGRLGPQVP